MLEQYKTSKRKQRNGNVSEKAAAVVCDGVQKYFDLALARSLLYRYERPQYV